MSPADEPEGIRDDVTPLGYNKDMSNQAVPSHLSPSSASLFVQCPRRWRYRYLDRLPEPVGPEALIGTFAHRVLELLLAEPPQQRTTDRARSIAREVWPETADDPDFAALDLDETASRAFRWKGWRAIEGLWTVEDPTTVEVAATERRVSAEVGGVPFVGIVDRLDRCADGLVITDYKSGRPPSTRFQADKLSQVLLYAAAVAATEGETPVRARLVYLGSQVLETPATDESMAEAVTALRATWDHLSAAVDSDTFEPRPGPLCAWCPHLGSCAEGTVEVRRRHEEGRLRADAPGAALVA